MNRAVIRFYLIVTALALAYMGFMYSVSPTAGDTISTLFISIVFLSGIIATYFNLHRDRRLIYGSTILASVQLRKKGCLIYNTSVYFLLAAIAFIFLYTFVISIIRGSRFGFLQSLLIISFIVFFITPLISHIFDVFPLKDKLPLKFTEKGIVCGSSLYQWSEIKIFRWINTSDGQKELSIKIKRWPYPYFVRFWGYRFDTNTENLIEQLIKEKATYNTAFNPDAD